MNKKFSTPRNVGLEIPEPAAVSTASAEAFRKVMRGFASTVTIVSTECAGSPFGMVATAVVSVSVAPPLLMVAVQHSASSHDAIRRRGGFCVNVLSNDQQDIAASFLGDRHKRFTHGRWGETDGLQGDISGLPYLVDAQSVLICAVDEAVPSRTHTLFMGRVERIESGPTVAPLLYCEGAFGAFSVAGLNRAHTSKACRDLGGQHAET
jgi:flavin reductase